MSEEPVTAEGRAATAVRVVLVLHDELRERAVAAKHLRRSGFDVIEAADANEARRIVDGVGVDVLLADLETLGQSNELGLLRWLRERHPAVKTILTSGTETNMAAMEGGGIFLSKPYRLIDLDYCLQRVLSTDRAQTDLGASNPRPGGASPNRRPAPHKADGRGDETFKQSMADLSRQLAERAARQRAIDPAAAKAARRAALQAYDRTRGRRLRLVMGFALGAVVGSVMANLLATVGSPLGAAAPTAPALSEVASATSIPDRFESTEASPPSPPANVPPAQPSSVVKVGSARPEQPASVAPLPNPTPLRREEVKEVQARLQSFGFNPGPADGVVGTRTASAVMRYQQERGQLQTGTVDRELLDLLRQDTAPQLAQNATSSDGQAARSRGRRRSDPFQPVWAAANRVGQWLEAQVR